MKNIKGLSLFELLIATLIAVFVTLALVMFNRLTAKKSAFIDHITTSHGIDCSANATAKKQCEEFGISDR